MSVLAAIAHKQRHYMGLDFAIYVRLQSSAAPPLRQTDREGISI
jgi:hypothetical protein